MPNRILKESICTSEKISGLTDFEFRLWAGLITQADDAGRGDARPAIIKGRVFPLRERISAKDIDASLHALAAKGCVSLYTVGGKPYFWFPSWAEHQRIRNCVPKYPGPEDSDNLPQLAADCGNSPQSAADCRLNPIQSNPNPNPNTESESNTLAHSAAPAAGESAKTDQFEVFWKAYPKKKSKGDAKKAFSALKNVNLDQLLSALEEQKKSKEWLKEGGQFIPYPAKWLRRCCWEDEQEVNTENAENTDYGTIL